MTYQKKVVIIGTGGTIAGKGSSATDLTGYKAGSLAIESLLKEVPTLEEYGPFESEQFSNIESSDITPLHWVKLAQRVNYWCQQEGVAGVVITHGTDSMEETAYFLHLTVASEKPIVITGSMRPASGISAEGPLNLLNAVQTVRSKDAIGKGVMVLLNNYIDNARDVRKMNTTNVATFGNQVFGHMGIVQEGVPYFYNISTRKHTINSDFKAFSGELKRVEILHLYAGISQDLVKGIVQLPLDGLVVAGLGHGTVPRQAREILNTLSIPVVRASKTNSGMVTKVPTDQEGPYLVSDTLTAEKARVLMMLALTKTTDKDLLQQYFKEY